MAQEQSRKRRYINTDEHYMTVRKKLEAAATLNSPEQCLWLSVILCALTDALTGKKQEEAQRYFTEHRYINAARVCGINPDYIDRLIRLHFPWSRYTTPTQHRAILTLSRNERVAA